MGGCPVNVSPPFGKTFMSGLATLFAGGVRQAGITLGAGLFAAGQKALHGAVEQARAAALAAAKKAGIKLPNLAGLASFVQDKVKSLIEHGRKVATGAVKPVV